MSKNGFRGYITLFIIFVVFSVLAFAPPFEMTTAFWLGYLFGVLAIAFQIYVFKISFSRGEDAKSKFYGFPIAKIGVCYLIVQLVISFIEICTAKYIPAWVVVVINIIPIAIAAIGCIAADVMRDEVVRQDVQIKKNVDNMRSLQSMSAALPGMCQDADLKKQLLSLAEDFRFSDPVSSEATSESETELKFLVGEIQRALSEGDIKTAENFCLRAKTSLAERNRICKLSK